MPQEAPLKLGVRTVQLRDLKASRSSPIIGNKGTPHPILLSQVKSQRNKNRVWRPQTMPGMRRQASGVMSRTEQRGFELERLTRSAARLPGPGDYLLKMQYGNSRNGSSTTFNHGYNAMSKSKRMSLNRIDALYSRPPSTPGPGSYILPSAFSGKRNTPGVAPGNGPHRNESWQTQARDFVPGRANDWHSSIGNSNSMYRQPATRKRQPKATKTWKRQTATSGDYDAQLKQLLEECAPDKLCNANMLLSKWEGREAELLAKIKDKYYGSRR